MDIIEVHFLPKLQEVALRKKVTVVGAGNVGANCALRIADRELADVVLVTDDNPRTESPAAIRRAILAAAPGARDAGDRRTAIARAISELESSDILVIAGKGHEDYQILPVLSPSGEPLIGEDGKPLTHKVPFSDSRVVREIVSPQAVLVEAFC